MISPFAKNSQLDDSLDMLLEKAIAEDETLPGYPTMQLRNINELCVFLTGELCTPELDEMAPHLWMLTTQSSANVNPLHAQKVKGREIVICEHPRLHLVWNRSHIFIKPLPKYLLAFAFWEKYLINPPASQKQESEKLLRAAKGFLRTYHHLIRYESDFNLAQSCGLLPRTINWEEFSKFIYATRFIQDHEVSPRYCYGEIRLSRLNFYAKFLLHRFRYEWGRAQYSALFLRFYPHLLFIFALLSILLNAMQVELAVEPLASHSWIPIWYIARYFSVICIVVVILTSVLCFVVPTWVFVDEWVYALRKRRQRARAIP